MDLNNLEVYQVAMEIGDLTWEWTNQWDYLPKVSVGKQWREASDSIPANISEAEGR